MMKTILFSILVPTIHLSLYASPDTLIKLWNNEIPNSVTAHSVEEVVSFENDILAYSHVVDPTLEVFLPTPRSANNIGMLILPGGGYAKLAYDWEGHDIAKFLNAHGIAAFVLKYRLPDSASSIEPHLTPILDARRAMRIIRNKASEFKVDVQKVGVIGFSAGGHLASTLLTSTIDLGRFNQDEIDQLNHKPNFGALIYPVTTMDESYTHMGSRTRLLGKSPSQSLIDTFSPEFNVAKETPPIYLLHSMDDGAVPIRGSILLYQSLLSNGVPTEAHFYPSGGHGYSLARKHEHLNAWPESLIKWMKSLPQLQ